MSEMIFKAIGVVAGLGLIGGLILDNQADWSKGDCLYLHTDSAAFGGEPLHILRVEGVGRSGVQASVWRNTPAGYAVCSMLINLGQYDELALATKTECPNHSVPWPAEFCNPLSSVYKEIPKSP